MNNRLLKILTTWPFLICLTTLLANDWWLKAAFPNMLTGKLSDFAGVGMVALLLFSGLPHREWIISLLIACAFLWWKSPLSDSFIHLINSVSAIQIERTVDYSDLLALLIVPACLYVTQVPDHFRISSLHSRKIVTIPLAAATIFAIMGTSALHTSQEYVIRPISPSAAIPREGLVNAIAEVAAKHGLCYPNPYNTPESARFMGKGSLSMSYVVSANNAVSFTIVASSDFSPLSDITGIRLFSGKSGKEKADALRTSLKTLLAERFEGLEYVEPLRQ